MATRTAIDILSKDPVMRRLVDTQETAAIGKNPIFGSLIGSVISQQLSESASATIFKRLQGISPITPESLLGLDIELLRSCGISKQKAGYILTISQAALKGELDNIENQSDEEAIRILMQIKGVGLWTAQMVLIFALGRQDVWSCNDAGLMRAAKKLYNIQGVDDFIELGIRFKPYRSYASWYLWCSLSAK